MKLKNIKSIPLIEAEKLKGLHVLYHFTSNNYCLINFNKTRIIYGYEVFTGLTENDWLINLGTTGYGRYTESITHISTLLSFDDETMLTEEDKKFLQQKRKKILDLIHNSNNRSRRKKYFDL